jgi:hypothetical protein
VSCRAKVSKKSKRGSCQKRSTLGDVEYHTSEMKFCTMGQAFAYQLRIMYTFIHSIRHSTGDDALQSMTAERDERTPNPNSTDSREG